MPRSLVATWQRFSCTYCTTVKQMILRKELGYMCFILRWPWYSSSATFSLNMLLEITLNVFFFAFALLVIFYMLHFNIWTSMLIIAQYVRSSLLFISPHFHAQCVIFGFLLSSVSRHGQRLLLSKNSMCKRHWDFPDQLWPLIFHIERLGTW